MLSLLITAPFTGERGVVAVTAGLLCVHAAGASISSTIAAANNNLFGGVTYSV